MQSSAKRQRVDVPTAPATVPVPVPAPKSSSTVSTPSPTLSLPPQAIVAYKQAIALQDREKPDARFVTRTLGELLRRSTVDNVLVPERSECLARLLCDEFRCLGVTPTAAIDGVIRIVHAPRTRRAGGRDVGAVVRLFRVVLLGSSASQSATDLDAAVGQWTQTLQELIVPRRFLVPGISFFQADDRDGKTPNLATTEAALKVYAVVLKRAQGATPPVSSDKAILTYLCALHCELCRSRDAVATVRVLALDVLKAYPSIKGLVLIRQLVDIWPSVLNVDARADDAASTAVSTSPLRQAMLEALVVLTQRSMQRQELYLDQSALAVLSSIADALDLPTLLAGCDEDDDGAASAARLWSQAQAQAHAATQEIQEKAPAVDELAMALELSALIRGPEWVERHWTIATWTKSLECGRSSTAAIIVRLMGSIARGLMQAPRVHQDGDNGGALVAASIDWMMLRLEAATVDTVDEEVAVVATELVELLLALSSTWLQSTPPSAVWLALQTQRPAWLGRLLRWMSRKRLETHLSPRALRRLRLVVLSARPLGSGTVSITV
ncbi:hypothetical protein PINS_up007635 [Pythium insidiosum]|nr:hypothetical protein PINS_up007635 [Pythium insidiosum]